MTASKPESKKELVAFVEDIKRQWLATIDALIDPLILVRRDYTIAKANKAFADMAGREIKTILNEKCYETFANRKKPCVGCKMNRAAETCEAQDFELSDLRPEKFFEVTSQPIFDKDGELDGVVQVYRDRTEAKQLREKLLQTEKLSSIGLLAGGVAHEINNPLGGILVFSQMLLREMDKKSPHYEDVEEIYAATQRCKAIVENLLDFARTNPAEKADETEDVSMREVMTTALRFAQVSVDKSQYEVIEEYEPDDVCVHADRNKLIQLFLNLVQNSLQAMPDGGTLRIVITEKADVVSCEISDTGVGIPEKYRQKIFDPFFTTKEPGEGTGLGLAICYGIVNDFGGEMTVQSETNEGTTFSIKFPRLSKQERQTG